MAKSRIPKPVRICQVEGCSNKHKANGYCDRHHTQLRKYGKILIRTRRDPNEFVFKGDLCFVHLYNRRCEKIAEAVIDACDFDIVKGHKWWLSDHGYAQTSLKGHVKLNMSDLLMQPIPDGLQVDHKDRIRLNNRRSNLRHATVAQNNANVIHKNTSGFRGVHLDTRGVWIARISKNDKQMYLGSFSSKEAAALAYNKKAIEINGEFAVLNDVSKKYHRSWIMPGQDASKADVMSKAVAEKLHTVAVVSAYNTKMAELAAEPK